MDDVHEDVGLRQDLEISSDIKFSPSVCVQRYEAVKRIVRKYQPKKVLDMGCGECSLLKQLKREDGIEQLTGVDIDKHILEANRHFAKPLTYEYLHPRLQPFTVCLYEGSIGQKDTRMKGYDLVICVEIIEHLYPETLALVPEVVLGYMQPRIAVFTTPNADFNVLFPNFKRFRHWDHKFEWSRKDFQTWANQAAIDYSYSVTYEGIGAGPPGTEHLGCCTQMAVFVNASSARQDGEQDACCEMPYNLICEVKYPYQKVTMTTEEQILSEATLYLQKVARTMRHDKCRDNSGSDKEDSCDDKQMRTLSVSLETMMKYSCLRRVCPTVEKLRKVLSSCQSVSMSEDGMSVSYRIEEQDSDSGTSSDESHTEPDADWEPSPSDLMSRQEETWDW